MKEREEWSCDNLQSAKTREGLPCYELDGGHLCVSCRQLLKAAPGLLTALNALIRVAVENLPSTVHPEIGVAFQAVNKAEGR